MKQIFTIIIIFFSCNTIAQEIDISMPFISSQFLSPANAGSGIHNSRVQGNMKSQFTGNANLFNTIIAGWDTRFNTKGESEKSAIGFGLQIMSDQLIGGALQTNYLTSNFSYRLYLDQDRSNNIAMGMGLSVAQTSYDQTKLTFGDMYNSNGTQISFVSPNEVLNKRPTSYAVNTGLVFTRLVEETFFQLGANSFSYTMPELTGGANKLTEATETRYNGFLNFERYLLGDFTFLIHGSYNLKGKERSYFAGGGIGAPLNYDLEFPKRIYFGASYRQNIAISPFIALMNVKYNFSISYDIYQSVATTAQLRQNGFEVSFSHFFGKKKAELFRSLLN